MSITLTHTHTPLAYTGYSDCAKQSLLHALGLMVGLYIQACAQSAGLLGLLWCGRRESNGVVEVE